MYQHTKQKGFTLVEMIVAVFIFSIVMLVAVGALVSIVEANRKAQNVKSVMNNLNFSLDSMTRSIRVGNTYDCGVASCASDGSEEFTFISTDGDEIRYRHNTTDKSIERSTDGGLSYQLLTAPEVSVDFLKFYVGGENPIDNEQPRVLVVMKGTAGPDDKTRTEFSLQTLITQRVLDR